MPSADKKKIKKTKKSTTKKTKAKLNTNFVPFLLLAAALLSETCLIFNTQTGNAGKFVHMVLTGMFGASAYLLPAGLLIISFYYFEMLRRKTLSFKYVLLAIFCIFFSAAHSVLGFEGLSALTISPKDYFYSGTQGASGGFIGGVIGKLLVTMFSDTFGAVMAIIVCICALSFFIGTGSGGIWGIIFTRLGVKHAPAKKTPVPVKQKTVPETIEEPARPTEVMKKQSFSQKNVDTTVFNSFSYGDTFKNADTIDAFSTLDLRESSKDNSREQGQTKAPEGSLYTGYTHIPTDKNGRPTAYSPFANPFANRNDILGNDNGYQKKTEAPKRSGRAYSPFSNPIESINDRETQKQSSALPPQAYIACDAKDSYGNTSPASAKSPESVSGYSFSENIFPNADIEEPGSDTPSESTAFFDISAKPDPVSVVDIEAPVFEEDGSKNIDYERYSEDIDDEEDDDFEENSEPPFEVEDIRVTSSTSNTEIKRVHPSHSQIMDVEEEDDSHAKNKYAPRYPNYVYPKFDLLDPPRQTQTMSEDDILEVKNKLLGKLASFKVEASLSGYSVGPTVTRYELTPGPGVKVKQITSLIEDLSLELQSDGVRIAAVPGKSVIGVEVPNEHVSVVSLRSLIENREFIEAKSKITVCVGLTVTGKPIYMNIDDMPHVLIAGETKSGKSVAINCMILSLLYRASPDEVQLILIDPKRVELNIYSKIPHLIMPVIDDPKRAAAALQWAVNEMDRRYVLLDEMGVRNRDEYCELREKHPELECMPQIVIVIDELADLMLQVRDHVEGQINRIAALARACGMHLVVGTQRPSVDIITGLIKANIPARISFKVSSQQDSRIIIGSNGAEKLIGRGDMLYQATGAGRLRVQGAYVGGSEIKRVLKFINDNNGVAQFDAEVMHQLDSEYDKMNKNKKQEYFDDDDDATVDGYEPDFDLMCRAIEYVMESGKTATNNIQRHLRVGFNRAADIVDAMESLGFISAKNGSRPRDVLVDWEMYEQWKLSRRP